jgi:hypothetical protein
MVEAPAQTPPAAAPAPSPSPPVPVPAGVVALSPERPADAWTWVVEYADGAELRECGPDGGDHGFAEVDHARAARLLLLPAREGLTAHVVTVDAAAGERLIFFRRRTVRTDPATDEAAYEATVHCVGFQRTTRGVNFQTFTFLFDDGSVLVSSDRNAV